MGGQCVRSAQELLAERAVTEHLGKLGKQLQMVLVGLFGHQQYEQQGNRAPVGRIEGNWLGEPDEGAEGVLQALDASVGNGHAMAEPSGAQLQFFQLTVNAGTLRGSLTGLPANAEFTAGQFREHPEQAPWWMQLFLVDHALVGSGGFVGPPVEGVVEIGYEIAPEFRGRGYATAAAQAMIDRARVGGANTVVAHTLAQHNPSTGVLQKLGFRFVGEMPDDENGAIWRWELSRDDGSTT